MRAFVTGATGFLGRHLVARLLGRGMDVRCLVRPTSDVAALRACAGGDALGRLELCQGTMNRIDRWADALAGCDLVYHLAAELRGATAVLFANNVIATRLLLAAARDTPPRRFVLVSSLAVYGSGGLRRGDLLDEGAPLDPEPHRRDAYTYSKIAQERVAWEAHRAEGLHLVVVRPGVIYGPGRDCLTGRVGLRFGKVFVRLGGCQSLPYTFVENCAEALALAGIAPGVEGRAFNIVDDDLPTARALVKRYRAAVGPVRGVAVPGWAVGPLSGLYEWYHHRSRGLVPPVLTRYKSQAMWKPLRYSNAQAKAALGWRPGVTFAEGLERTFAWQRAHGGSSEPSRN